MYYTDDVIEESTEQKLLWNLLPLLCLLSMAATLNRLSLGYAAPALGQQLSISASQLGFAENLFCAGFVVASLPAAWLLLRLGARVWITGIMLATALFALAHALVWNAASLYAVHLLLGVSEAGLLPAMVFYLAQWMPEQHRAKAVAALIGSAVVVPLLAAPASGLLLLLGRWFDINDWRFLFLAEGLPTLWLALLAPGRLPLAPADAKWLPPSERIWLLDQLHRHQPPGAPTRFADGLRGAATWKLAAVGGIIGLVGSSLGLWVPLAMQETGYVPPRIGIGIMTAAAVLGVVALVTAALVWHSRMQLRRGLASGLALAGVCLGIAAVLPFGIAGVLLLAIVAVVAPAILALTWVLAPCILAGPAAAAGFAALSAAWMLGNFAAAGLAVVLSDAGRRCLVLGMACLVVAWLARGLDRRQPAELAASPASPGA